MTMTPQELVRQIRDAGGYVEAAGGALRFKAPNELIPHLKTLKPELLALLGATQGLTFDDCQRLLREWSGVCRERGQREPKAAPEVLAALWKRLDECTRLNTHTPASPPENACTSAPVADSFELSETY